MKRFLAITSILLIAVIFLAGCGDDTTTTTAYSGAAKVGDTVSVDYLGTLEDGTKFDSSYDRGEPLSFTVGAGQMISGFDAAVVGMKVGDIKTVTLPPEEAYGEWDERNIIKFDLSEFTDGQIPSVGDKIPLQYGSGQVAYFPVVEVTNGFVAVDTNHELAGKTLIFKIEMVSITPAAE